MVEISLQFYSFFKINAYHEITACQCRKDQKHHEAKQDNYHQTQSYLAYPYWLRMDQGLSWDEKFGYQWLRKEEQRECGKSNSALDQRYHLGHVASPTQCPKRASQECWGEGPGRSHCHCPNNKRSKSKNHYYHHHQLWADSVQVSYWLEAQSPFCHQHAYEDQQCLDKLRGYQIIRVHLHST